MYRAWNGADKIPFACLVVNTLSPSSLVFCWVQKPRHFWLIFKYCNEYKHTVISIPWAIFRFWYISFWTRMVHRSIQSFYNMHIIEKTGHFSLWTLQDQHKHSYCTNCKGQRDCKRLIVHDSFFFFEIVQTEVLRWQHQIERCSVKASMQRKPEFKSSTSVFLNRRALASIIPGRERFFWNWYLTDM